MSKRILFTGTSEEWTALIEAMVSDLYHAQATGDTKYAQELLVGLYGKDVK